MKKWYKSRTIIFAILQGLAGVLTAVLSQYPELQSVGYVAIVKSLIDIGLRIDTKDNLDI